MLLGAHVSVAGGPDRAFSRAEAMGAECMQVFTRSQHRWKSEPIPPQKVTRFHEERRSSGIGPLMVHDSYLINLAGTDADKLRRSRTAFLDEVSRADLLGIEYLVTHPGSHLGAGIPTGIRRFARRLDQCLDEAGDGSRVTVLLETTSGQGSNLGHEFEQLRDVIGASRHPSRLGVCVDTCHVFAVGHELRTEEGYELMVEHMDATFGIDRVRGWHLNDSLEGMGSRRDRHADLGQGEIGLPAFERLARDARWAGQPACMETPGGPKVWARDIARLARARAGQDRVG